MDFSSCSLEGRYDVLSFRGLSCGLSSAVLGCFSFIAFMCPGQIVFGDDNCVEDELKRYMSMQVFHICVLMDLKLVRLFDFV